MYNQKKTESEVRTEREKALMDSVDAWASFYRANIHRFAQDFLGVKLKIFQQINLCMFSRFCNSIFLASRGGSKTYIAAIYVSCRAILYPGSRIAIASKTRKQASEVIDKIVTILLPNSPNLDNEIKDIKFSQYESFIQFKNGSRIFVVTANEESGRGHRANVLLVDEARLVDKQIIDDILKKYLTASRHPGFLDNPEYANYQVERNQALYTTSCGYEGEWLYDLVLDFIDLMSPTGSHFCCSIPYQLAIKENLLRREFVEELMLETNFDSIKHLIEMESLFWLQGESGLFNIGDINKIRQLPYAWYPSSANINVIDKRMQIPPKVQDEVRIMSCDIALMASSKSHQNDATSIFINQMVKSSGKQYINNIVYTQNCEGLRTDTQALIIRRLFKEFDCDKLVIDCRNIGLGVVDCLMTDILDPDTGEIYPALSCCNNEQIADRCVDKTAPRVIYAVTGTADFNSKCATILREAFRQGSVRLLIPEYDAEERLSALGKKYTALSPVEQHNLLPPYINTSLLINELIKLEVIVQKGLIKVKETSGMRKDRYSSLSYNIYVAKEIEREMNARTQSSSGLSLPLFVNPVIKRSNDRRWG